MSIESARADILDWVKDAGRDELRPMLDALILEVEAAQLCYWKMERDDREMCPEATAKKDMKWSPASDICPSCAARAKLAAL